MQIAKSDKVYKTPRIHTTYKIAKTLKFDRMELAKHVYERKFECAELKLSYKNIEKTVRVPLNLTYEHLCTFLRLIFGESQASDVTAADKNGAVIHLLILLALERKALLELAPWTLEFWPEKAPVTVKEKLDSKNRYDSDEEDNKQKLDDYLYKYLSKL